MVKAGPHDSKATTNDSASVEMFCPKCDASYEEGSKHCPRDGAKLVRIVEKKDSLVGLVLDERFTIQAKLGAGGMGAVYRALQHSVGREVAIKVIEPRLAGHKDITKRFLREAQLSSRLSQPNTVTVLDFGQTSDGLLYLVMELLAGRSLDQILRSEGALAEKRVVRIGIQMCDALDAASALHIIHRDLKPANVVILDDPPGRDMVKVLDFGIAKSLAGDQAVTSMTQSDMILGTPSYIAPEAVSGEKVDARSDLYSLGVMLYEMATGKLPFAATTITSMLASHTSDPPRPLPNHLSPALRGIIEKLLAKSPAARFQSPAEVRAALSGASLTSQANDEALAATAAPAPAWESEMAGGADLAFAPTSATPASALIPRRKEPEPIPDPIKSRGPLWLFAGAAGVLSIVVLVVVLSQGSRAVIPATPDAGPSPVLVSADASPPTTTTFVRIETSPEAARAILRKWGAAPDSEGETLCPSTPCKNKIWPKSEGLGEVWFYLDGYEPEVREVDLKADHQNVRARLRKIPTTPAAKKESKPTRVRPPRPRPPKPKPPTPEPRDDEPF